jgi:hypothetical protein
MRIQGWDISLNHGAMVELDFESGEMTRCWFVTDSSGYHKKFKSRSFLIPKDPKIKDNDKKNILRRDRWQAILHQILDLEPQQPAYVAVEDYSYGSRNKSHQIGELGGDVRSMLFHRMIPFRLYDIMHIKLFVARDANANKDKMMWGCLERWGLDFREYRNPKTKKQDVQGDLCDAYGIAQLLRTELMLRQGKVTLEQLSVEDIQVFNCVTKTHPINILARDFVQQ